MPSHSSSQNVQAMTCLAIAIAAVAFAIYGGLAKDQPFLVMSAALGIVALGLWSARRWQQRLEQVRQEAKAQQLAVVNRAFDAIVTVDECGLIDSCNAAARELFGYQGDAPLGESVFTLISEPERSGLDGLIRGEREPESKTATPREVMACRRDGSLFPAAIAVSEFTAEGRRRFAAAVRDLSEIKAAEARHHKLSQDMDIANEELDYLRRRQQELVSSRTSQLEKQAELLTAANHSLSNEIAERRRVEQSLRASETRYRLLIESITEGVFGVDLNGNCTFINPAGLQLLGYADSEQLVGKPTHALIQHTNADGTLCTEEECMVHRTMQEDRNFHSDTGMFRRSDGTFFQAEYRSHPIRTDTAIIGAVVTFTDVSERKKAEELQRQAVTVFNNTLESILITDAEGNIEAVNQAYTKITGFEAHEVVAKNPRIHQSGLHDKAFYKAIWHSVDNTGRWQGEVWNRHKNGEVFPAWESISAIRDEKGQITNYISVMSDISPVKQAEERLRFLANHDALTGLPNRLGFMSGLQHALKRAKRHQRMVALLFLDLDRFKLINDTLGHAAGDRLLQIVAERLKKCLRAEDLTARLGGDEFTVILDNIAHMGDAAKLAQKILRAVAKPIRLNGHEVASSASIGISIYPNDAANAEELAKAADVAMYRAKNSGRNKYEFYIADLTDQAMQHLTIENELRKALAEDQFVLHYQPQIELASGTMRGVEALLRWRHPERGLMMPEQFIPIAEESGVADAIGEWVLNQAMRQSKLWREAGLPALSIAVNISGRHVMYGHLVETVKQAVEQNGLPQNGEVVMEITESILQSDDKLINTLQQIRDFGVSIAIDDFGKGYSSLSHLKRLPIDVLKIDRGYLHNVPADTDNKAIAAAIISMGHSLGLKVVAAGVETAEQLEFLAENGCDVAQGMLISDAIAPEQIEEMVRKGRAPALKPSAKKRRVDLSLA